MDISSFFLNHDLAGFILTVAAQSILISLFGISIIKLLRIKSAPVRSLVCTGVIAVLGLVLIVSAGFRISGVSWSETGLKPVSTENEIPVLNSHSQPAELSRSFVKTNFKPVSSREEPNIVPLSEALPGKSDNSEYSHSFLLAPAFISVINSLGIIWFAGMLFLMIRLGYGFFQVNKFRKSLKPVSDMFYTEMAHSTSRFFWNNRTPDLYRSPDIESPLAIGLFKPIIIIPEKLFYSLNENELKSILLHEFSHIYHCDQFMGVIKRIVLAFHWWNPIVHNLSRTHEQAREEVSDNYVLRDIPPRIYTTCLVNLAEKLCLISNLPGASCMAGKNLNLHSRVEQILSAKRSIAMNTKLYLKVTAVSIGFILTFGAAGLHGKVQSSADIDKPEISPDVTASHQIVEKQILLEEKIKKPKKIDAAPKIKSTVVRKSSVEEENKILPEITEEQTQNSIESISNNIKTVQAVSQDKLIAPKTAENKIKNTKKEIQLSDAGSRQEQHKKLSDTARQEHYTADDCFSKGKTLLEKGEPDKAVSYFNRALELGKKSAEVYMFRANAYVDINQQEKAMDDYNKAIELNSDYADAYSNRGVLFFEKQEYEKAIEDFKKAVKKEPDHYYAYYNWGNTYVAQRKYRKAASCYNKAIKINPGFIKAYINMGMTHYIKKSFRKAVRDYTKALEINENADLYVLRGNAYSAWRKHDDAINDYTKAINLSPDLSNVYIQRGQEYVMIKDYKKAIADYSKAIETVPENYKCYLNRGNAYFEEKEYYRAISDYSKVIEMEPDIFTNITAYKGRSEAYRLTNQVTKAAMDLKMVEKLTPSPLKKASLVYSSQMPPEVREREERQRLERGSFDGGDYEYRSRNFETWKSYKGIPKDFKLPY